MVFFHKLKLVSIEFFEDVPEDVITHFLSKSVYATTDKDEEEGIIIYNLLIYSQGLEWDFLFYDAFMCDYSIYSLEEVEEIAEEDFVQLKPVLDYIGLNLTDDEILDEILECPTYKQLKFDFYNELEQKELTLVERSDFSRQDILEGVLFYRNEIKGKEKHYWEFHVHLEDEFVNRFEKYILSVEFISRNEDTSRSVIGIETTLTYQECLNAFNDWIVRDNQEFSFRKAMGIAA